MSPLPLYSDGFLRDARADNTAGRGKGQGAKGNPLSLTPHPSPLTPHPSPLTPYPLPLTPYPFLSSGVSAVPSRDLPARGASDSGPAIPCAPRDTSAPRSFADLSSSAPADHLGRAGET